MSAEDEDTCPPTCTEAVESEEEEDADVKSDSDSDGECHGGGKEDFVSAILKKQFVDGKPEYLIKWTFCEEDTWEPMENLENCRPLVEEFERKWRRSKVMQRNTEELTGIEKIMDSRIRNGEREYLVKWVACSHSGNSWEPWESVQNKPELIREFEREEQRETETTEEVGAGAAPAAEKGKSRPSTSVKNVKKSPTKSKGNVETRTNVGRKRKPPVSGSAKKVTPTSSGTRPNVAKKRKLPVSGAAKKVVPSTSRTRSAVARKRRRIPVPISAGSAKKVGRPTSGTRSDATKKRKLPSEPVSRCTRKKFARASSCTKAPVVPIPVVSLSSSSSDDEDDEPKIEKILNATDASGSLQYLVKYEGEKELRRVPADQIHAKCPQVALAFYVERRAWEVPI